MTAREIDQFDKLVMIKKVTGFANLGVMPSSRYVERASAFIEDLKPAMNLESAGKAVAALGRSILPSQDICQRGMAQVDAHLRPMRQARRAESMPESRPADRPRA